MATRGHGNEAKSSPPFLQLRLNLEITALANQALKKSSKFQ